MDTQNEAEYYKVEIARALFPESKKDQESATWDEISDVIQVRQEHLTSVNGVIAQIEKDNSVNRSLLNRSPEDALDIIRDQLNEYQEQVEELQDQKKQLIEEGSEAIDSQRKAAEEILSDLGFDIWELTSGTNTLDFTKPGMLEEMKRQMEKMK